MPRNLYCNVLGSSPNVQNLVSKIFALQTFGFKSLVSRLGLRMFKSRYRLEFLLKISVSQRQCLASVSKILAETPALEENALDHKVDAAMVEGPVEKVSRREVREAIRKMKQGKAAGLSEVTMEMIVAGGRIAEEVMLQLCQRVLDGKEISDEWKTCVVVPIFKGKGDVMNFGSYRGVKLLEHGMKIIERVLERRIRALVDFDEASTVWLHAWKGNN